jgi:hypothetical protein
LSDPDDPFDHLLIVPDREGVGQIADARDAT